MHSRVGWRSIAANHLQRKRHLKWQARHRANRGNRAAAGNYLLSNRAALASRAVARYRSRAMHQQALDLRPGALIRYEGRMCTVVWWNILRNDRRQFIQMRIKDLQSGRIQELKEHSDSKFETLEKEEREMSHSYTDGEAEVFFTMDGEEFRCPKVAAEDALKWPSDSYKAVFVSGELVAIEPPKLSVLEITETTPPIKGVGSGTKDATLANGMTIKVSQLCDVGDSVRIDTETGEFKDRVKG